MNIVHNNQGEVMVISPRDSFLAKSLVSKIESNGVKAEMSHGDIKEIDSRRENTGEKRKKTILIVDDDITYMHRV